MEQFNVIFEYLPEHHIAICKSHRQGIVKSQLKTHLNRKHQEYVRQTRLNIVKAVQQERLLQDWAVTQDEVVYPTAECAPLPHLPVYQDGLRCQNCGYINRNIDRIQEHCKQGHRWESRSRAGRPSDKQRMWTTVSCQKFHNTNKLGRLFQVGGEAESRRAPDSADGDVSQAIEMSLTQAMTRLEDAEKEKCAAIEADTDRYDFNEWLNRAGWARHLQGLKRDWLLAMVVKPTHKERALFDVCWAVRMVIWRAQQASKSSVVGMPAMMYINRREFGNHTNEKPFNAQQTGKTMVKYSDVWVAIIAYIWRTHELPVVDPRNDGKVEGRRPPYHINSRQYVCMERIKMIVGRHDGEEEEDEDWLDELESDGSEDERLDEQQEEALQGHVLQLMLALLDHVLGDNEYTSALISGLAVLGISSGSGWLSPLIYTPKLSAVVSTSRMLVLYQSTQMRQEKMDTLAEQEGWGPEDAAAMAPSHHQLVQEMANRFMTLTEYGGKPTPMDTILRLRAFGFKIRFTTNAEGVIDWVGDTLLYSNI
jgi:hypothetical protein